MRQFTWPHNSIRTNYIININPADFWPCMQISYDRQLSEISAYRNRILLFQVSMMLRKTRLDLYIITDEFSLPTLRVYAFNTLDFRSRDRSTPKSVGSINVLSYYRIRI